MSSGLSSIRLRYSSIVNYAAMLYRLLIAVGFVIIVARRLPVEEFGLWGVILSISAMLAVPVSLWGWWSQRMHARGVKEAFGTGLWLTIGYVVPASALYLALALVEEKVVGWGLGYMVEALPLLALLILDTYLGMMAGVVRPELLGYKGFLYETTRILVAYLLVVMLGFRLDGAIYAVESALLLGVSFMLASLAKLGSLNLSFSRSLASSWIRGLVVPGISTLQRFLKEGVRTVLSWTTGSEVPVAYLSIGLASEAPLLRASGAITPALYARSLRGGGGWDLEESLKLYLAFTGYMLASFIMLAKPLVSLYNPAYLKAYLVVPLVGIYAAMTSLGTLYVAALQGVEEIDVEGVPRLKSMLRSYLFKAPLIMLLGTIISYAVMVPATMAAGSRLAEAEAAAVSLIVGSTCSALWLMREARSRIPHKLPLWEAFSTGVASLLVALYYALSGAYGLEVKRFWVQTPILVLHVSVAGVIYVAALYAASPWFRRLVKAGMGKISLSWRRLP